MKGKKKDVSADPSGGADTSFFTFNQAFGLLQRTSVATERPAFSACGRAMSS